MNKVNSIREALAEMQLRLAERAGDGFAKLPQEQFDNWIKNNPAGAEKAKQARAEAQARMSAASAKTNTGATPSTPKPATPTAPPNTGQSPAAAKTNTGGAGAPPAGGSTTSSSTGATPSSKPAALSSPTAKPGMSTLGKVGRAMPFVGAALGAADAVSRFKDGDYTGAAISAAGGAASFIPKIGTAAALGAVGANMARDAVRSAADDKKAEGSTPSSNQGSGSTPAAAAPAKAEPAKATPPAPAAAAPAKSGVNSADKAVGVVKTKGGDYNIYKKGSETAADFRNTYASATKAGAGSFKWKDAQGNERTYKTSNAKGGEYKAPAAAPAAASPNKDEKKATFSNGSSQGSAGDAKMTVTKDTPAAPVAPASSGKEGEERADQIANKTNAIAGGASPAAAAREFGGAVKPNAAQIQPTPADVAQAKKNNAETGGTNGLNPTARGTFADPDVLAKVRQDNIGKQNDLRIKKTGEEPGFSGAAGKELEKAAPTQSAPQPPKTEKKEKKTVKQYDALGNYTGEVEENHSPLIASFLKLQEKKTGNMFEAAKKLKGDQHKLDKNKNGMLDKNDFEKLRSEEIGTGMVKKDGKDYVPDSIAKNPNMQASKDGPSKSDKDKLNKLVDKVQKEEVEFSAEELAHIELVLDEGRGRPPGSKNKPKEGTAAAVGAGTETNGRDPRQHIQVIAGQAAGGRSIEFNHNDGSKTTIGPAMGRKIVDHLGSMKPADRQAAVNKMHNSADHMKGM